MIDAAQLQSALAEASATVRPVVADDQLQVDGVQPSLVAHPRELDELAAVVGAADRARAKVIPWGAGTRMTIGMPPRAADVAVRTDALDEIIEYEPADLTITLQAGMRLGALQERLRQEGQMLALDPAASDRATIGGLIAANASGPIRLYYGSARDIVIGTKVVNADGVISKAGGRVVKNVAGYDLNKLYIGSLGTVGIIVELSFKLHPLPQAQGMLVASFASYDDAAAAVGSVFRSPLGPGAIELLDADAAKSVAGVAVPSGGCLVIVAALGFEKAVIRQLADLREMCARADSIESVREGARLDRLWSGIREFNDPSLAGTCLLKLAVPPSRSAAGVQELRRVAAELGFEPTVMAHAGSGVAYARLRGDSWDADANGRLATLVERSRQFARGEGGSLVVEACPVAAKSLLDVWGDVGSSIKIMRALKTNLDPNSTLNPGRYVGGI